MSVEIEQDTEVRAIQDAWTEDNRNKRRWMIVEEADGFTVHAHTFDSVSPTSHYESARTAASRILQLLHIGPVAPQHWPETACIGSISNEGADNEEV
jgi:hypothetical protein